MYVMQYECVNCMARCLICHALFFVYNIYVFVDICYAVYIMSIRADSLGPQHIDCLYSLLYICMFGSYV